MCIGACSQTEILSKCWSLVNKMQEELCHNGCVFNMQNSLCSLYFRRGKSPNIGKINRSNSGLKLKG